MYQDCPYVAVPATAVQARAPQDEPAWPSTAPTDWSMKVTEVGRKPGAAGCPDLVVDSAGPGRADPVGLTEGRGLGRAEWLGPDAEPLGPGLFTVFDNGGPPSPLRHSIGAVVKIDAAAGTASVVATVTIPTPIYAETQGDLQRLPDGSWWVGWGNVNESSQVSASGTQLYEAHTPAGSESYRTLRFAWSAQPATRPALALTRVQPAAHP